MTQTERLTAFTRWLREDLELSIEGIHFDGAKPGDDDTVAFGVVHIEVKHLHRICAELSTTKISIEGNYDANVDVRIRGITWPDDWK
jgi:hypothetical protein